MIKIGVVCEGPTDFHAIQSFFGASLMSCGVETKFLAVQPSLDNTQPEGGWGNVLLWLCKNPPAARIQQYFEGGLFGGTLGKEKLDCILIHLDSDILTEPTFCSYVERNYNYMVVDSTVPNDRADQIRNVIELAANFDAMTKLDVSKHVTAPAVESTETWCVAAFNPTSVDTEILSGPDLTNAFMMALEASEGRTPSPPYASANKNVRRRLRFCETHKTNSNRVIQACQQFAVIHDKLVRFAD